MTSKPFLAILTAVNLVLLVFLLMQTRIRIGPGGLRLETSITGSVLRGRALEIVDENDRTRASLQVYPPAVMADGTTYPETVLLRLVSSEGRPNVKLAATEDGSGLALGGDADPTLVHVVARGSAVSLMLRNQNGKEQLIKP
jgi:hypothetical protein